MITAYFLFSDLDIATVFSCYTTLVLLRIPLRTKLEIHMHMVGII